MHFLKAALWAEYLHAHCLEMNGVDFQDSFHRSIIVASSCYVKGHCKPLNIKDQIATP